MPSLRLVTGQSLLDIVTGKVQPGPGVSDL
jgi:hypothetical protein